MESANLLATAKMRKKELSDIIKKSGAVHKNDGDIGGTKQHWRDEVHKDDGTSIKNTNVGESDYTKELQLSMNMLSNSNGHFTAWDDVTSTKLDPEGVMEARKVKMKFFKQMNAHTGCPAECVERENGKLIDTKWIDINKGGSAHPNHGSRLVGMEFNQYKNDTLYASTPPLEGTIVILSEAATTDNNEHGKKNMKREVMVNGVRRAYFYA